MLFHCLYYQNILFKTESFTPNEITHAQEIALSAAQVVAPILKEHFGASIFSTKTNLRDWVTEWDTWAETSIRNKLRKFSDNIGIIGEENGAEAVGEVYWTVDPIDATSHFVRGNEFCTTMIALVDNGTPIASIVYDFVRGTAYTAALGQGAFKDTQVLRVSELPLESAYFELYTDEETEQGKTLLNKIQATGASWLRNDASGFTFVTVARGSTEAFISLRNPTAKVWDIAPVQKASR
jgi:fructose-1,6-bisphosphatase/inositol monophosphatase family enzyme